MVVEYSLCSDVGRVRCENQDCIFISEGDTRIYNKFNHIEHHDRIITDSPLIVAVFDGMGGEQEGATASYITAWATSEFVDRKPNVSLKRICMTANRYLCDYMNKNGIKSMGTTAVMVKINDEKAFVCDIGDSSVFKISSKGIKDLSVKHTMNVNGNGGKILTQHIGIPETEMQIEPHSVAVKVKEGDVFLLCSDGLTDVITPEEINEAVNKYDIADVSKELVALAMKKRSKDNISVVTVKITEEGII